MNIEGIDHDQIEAADEAARDPAQSASQLREHHGRISAMVRIMHGMRLPEADRATTLRGREQAIEQAQEMQGIATILDNLYRSLGRAIEQAEGREAIANADSYREGVEKAVEAAEALRSQYLEAQGLVERELAAQGEAKRAAGTAGAGKVGITAALFERALVVASEETRKHHARKLQRQTVLDG